MNRVLVRLLKRKTSVELDSSGFIKTELTKKDGSLDLTLSIYHLDELVGHPLIRTCAEHTAGNELDPQARACIDVTQTIGWNLLSSPTQNRIFNFKFSSEAHCEMKFDNEESLRQFAEQLVSQWQRDDEDVQAGQNVSVKDMTSYAYQKYLAKDGEWQEVCRLSEKVKRWVMKGEKIQ